MEQPLDPPDPIAYLFPDSSVLKKKRKKTKKLERILELQSTYLLHNLLLVGAISLPFELEVIL